MTIEGGIMIDARWETLHHAMSALSAACDYAQERDAAGFSSADAGIGHYLAALPVADWIDEYATTAHTFVRKYRRQLAGHPALELINQSFLPDAEQLSADEVLQDRRRARDVALTASQIARENTRIASESWIQIDDTTVTLAFPYNEDLIDEARAIRGRSYDPDTRANVYPLSSLPDVVAFADRHTIPVTDDARALASAVAADPAAFGPAHVTVDGTVFVIAAPYSPDLAPSLRNLNGGRSTWDRAARVHRISVTCDRAALQGILHAQVLRADSDAAALLAADAAAAPHVTLDGTELIIATTVPADVIDFAYDNRGSLRLATADGGLRMGVHVAPAEMLAAFTAAGLRLDEGVADALTAEAATQQANKASATATDGSNLAVPGLGVDLFPHQAVGVEHIVRNRRVIVGDDMGLGKTITSLAAIAATDTFPAVVACKPDLVPNWHTEIDRVLPGRRVYLAESMTARDIPTDTDIVIIGFNALAATAQRRTRTAADRYTWVEKLLALAPRAFIVDEGHLGKETTAARSQAMARVGGSVAAAEGGVVLDLTGTPLVNRPRELAQQLVMLGYLAAQGEPVTPSHLFGEFGGFLFRYCGPVKTEYGCTFNGHSNLAELRHRLLSWGLLIRRDESALDLPPFAMRHVELDPALLDPEAMAEYRRAESELIAYVVEQTRAAARSRGVDPGPEIARVVVNAEKAEHLVRLNALRKILGRAKMPAITAWVADQVAAGEKVMVAAHHREVVSGYANTFGGLTIRGGQSAAEKDADKRTFQTGTLEQAPVISVGIAAGGVGHTLTAARIGIQAELCWTPGELNQMAKRIHRIGQTRPVDYTVPVAADTVDEYMWNWIVTKQLVLDAILNGADPDGEVDFDPATEDENAAAVITWTLATRALEAA